MMVTKYVISFLTVTLLQTNKQSYKFCNFILTQGKLHEEREATYWIVIYLELDLCMNFGQFQALI